MIPLLDLFLPLGLLGLMLVLALVFAVRAAGAPSTLRATQAGSSVLLGRSAVDFFYWVLAPVVSVLARMGITANQVTLVSLVLGVAAAVAAAVGLFGICAFLAAISSLFDGLDGQLARATGKASDAGEVFDAAVDRVNEMAYLFGVAVYLRAEVPALVVTLLALQASILVSYATAKAEALRVEPPRGAMRRAERAVYLGGGAALVPVVAHLSGHPLPSALSLAPLYASLGLVAAVGNVSAARRFWAIAKAVEGRGR